MVLDPDKENIMTPLLLLLVLVGCDGMTYRKSKLVDKEWLGNTRRDHFTGEKYYSSSEDICRISIEGVESCYGNWGRTSVQVTINLLTAI